MKLSFHGAAGGVTGCCHLLQTARANVLLDFGLHQGGPEEESQNRVPPKLDARRLDAVVLSHAHIDHCGRLPLLPKMGFRGPIWCTPATRKPIFGSSGRRPQWSMCAWLSTTASR